MPPGASVPEEVLPGHAHTQAPWAQQTALMYHATPPTALIPFYSSSSEGIDTALLETQTRFASIWNEGGN